MYLLMIAGAMCIAYAALFALFPLFFRQPMTPPRLQSVLSVGAIAGASLLVIWVSHRIPDAEWGNRVLHTFGGGFVGVLACVLAARDSRVQITRLQFFVFATLIVLALGVGNELIEFTLQSTTRMVFADSVNDTWLDLTSNTVGAVIGQIVLLPFVRPAPRETKAA